MHLLQNTATNTAKNTAQNAAEHCLNQTQTILPSSHLFKTSNAILISVTHSGVEQTS